MSNIYFELTKEFNQDEPVVALASGQAVVFYRLAIMSKDGDWIIRETVDASRIVLAVLERHAAHMRPSAPLHPRWLQGGWSSHFEFADDRQRRIRCDFVSRPPRVSPAAIETLWKKQGSDLLVVDIESLVRMKQTQRAKDYAVIGELAPLLPPQLEIELTTDPDRIVALAADAELTSSRPAVHAARKERGRDAIVVELAREIDERQRKDRARIERYHAAAEPYLAEFRRLSLSSLPVAEAQERAVEIALQLLPPSPWEGQSRDDAQ